MRKYRLENKKMRYIYNTSKRMFVLLYQKIEAKTKRRKRENKGEKRRGIENVD